MADPERAALDAVRAHLDEAHAAADRLVDEARRAAADVPPRGWDDRAAGDAGRSELETLLALLGTLREAVPAELSQRLALALRELLLALRALIDWYLERLGEPDGGRSRVEVEDIPLD